MKVKKKRKRHLRKYKAASLFVVKQTGNRRRREEVKGKEEEELLFLNPEFFLRVTLEAKDCEKKHPKLVFNQTYMKDIFQRWKESIGQWLFLTEEGRRGHKHCETKQPALFSFLLLPPSLGCTVKVTVKVCCQRKIKFQ